MKTFSQIVDDYLKERSALGFKDVDYRQRMKRIVKLQAQIDYGRPILSEKTLERWAEVLPCESERTRFNRISQIRSLSIYMHRMGYDTITIPKHYVPYKDSTYKPYIFSKEELGLILSHVDIQCMEGVSPNASLVYPVLFRLLIGSGLRISEALAINKADYNPETGVIKLVTTKNNKERFIPIAESINERLKHYSEQMAACFKGYPYTDFLFPNVYGKPYHKSTIYSVFRKALWKSGIKHAGRGKGPRLHDLRHSYAVMVLNRGFSEGRQMDALLQALSIYMGHTGLKSTEKYLRMTKEMHANVTDKFTDKFGWVLEGEKNHENK